MASVNLVFVEEEKRGFLGGLDGGKVTFLGAAFLAVRNEKLVSVLILVYLLIDIPQYELKQLRTSK